MAFTPILIWWFVTLIFGLVGWPLAFNLLRFLPDRGFVFARPVGFLIVGYILWLGATFRLLQNNVGGIVVALVLALAIGLVWYRQQARSPQAGSILAWLKHEWRYVIAVELQWFTVNKLEVSHVGQACKQDKYQHQPDECAAVS